MYLGASPLAFPRPIDPRGDFLAPSPVTVRGPGSYAQPIVLPETIVRAGIDTRTMLLIVAVLALIVLMGAGRGRH